MSVIIGIDFGTTKTIAAILEGGELKVIPDSKGRESIPSLVMVTPEQDFFVGWEAKEHRRRYESRHITINSIKRSLGKEREKSWGWLQTYPQAVAALILGRMKIEVEKSLGRKVNQAVIAIPAHYDINQRWAIKQAAEVAGFEVLRLINEANAAAFAYMATRSPRDTRVLVFDFGGGTLDVSVLELGGGVCEVKATAGDGQLGGDDFDQLLIDHVLQQARLEFGEFAPLDPFQQMVLREAVVKAKLELSASTFAQIYVPGLIPTPGQSLPFQPLNITVTREKFDALSRSLLGRAELILKQALKDSYIAKLDAALLIGGTSRIPAVRDLVRRTLNMEPYVGVDPENCVAQGAAFLAGILSGEETDALMLDTCPNALSVGTLGGVATQIVPRNSTIPTRYSMVFTTARDNESEISVTVYEGDRPMAADNILIGEVTLMGIPPAPRGIPQIEVAFDLDVNSMLNVSAKDLGTGREARTAVRAPFRLSAQQLELIQAIVDQEMEKVLAQEERELALMREEEAKRSLQAMQQAIENFLARCGDQLTDQQRSLIEGGASLLSDYRERCSSIEEQQRFQAGLASEMDNILCQLMVGRGLEIFNDNQFAPWVQEAVGSLAHEESVNRSMEDFATRNRPRLESILVDLQTCSEVYKTQERVLSQLSAVPGAQLCFGLTLSSINRYTPPDLQKFIESSEDDSLSESLRLILLFCELSAGKPQKRRVAAARLLAEACRAEHLPALLNRVPDERNKDVQRHLMEACTKFPADVWLQQFFAADAETQQRYMSDPVISPPLRAALTDVLPQRNEAEQQRIREALAEIGGA
jgi:molecular chaperone DnaK